MNKKKITYNLVLIAVFSALSFVGVFVAIPLPAGKVHLGNFVCILAGLLCGGLVGGISGALGMTLNDLCQGYDWPSWTRTLIMKFIMGYVAGEIFRMIVTKKKSPMIGNLITSILFLGMFVTFTVMYANGYDKLDANGNAVALTKLCDVTIGDITKKIEINILLPIFLGIFVLLLLISLFISFKKSYLLKCVLFSTVLAVIVNIVGEFIVRYLLNIPLVGSDASFATAIIKIPSTVITGFVTLVIIMLIYYPIYKATKSFNFMDNIHLDEDDDIVTEAEEIENNNKNINE